jgi:ethanolamine utilization protein EutN
MLTGRVIGTATATVKHASMEGWKLLVVQPTLADGRSPDGDPILVVDRLGAGRGETVIVAGDGGVAGELLQSETTPVRWSVIGIRD